VIKIPQEDLSREALQGLIEAFVLREGTDYGHRDFTLQEKCEAVGRQLRQGVAEIWFDPETGSTTIRLRDEA
jgi:uncharacterized protein YheU (UPF0270 family)